MPDDFHHAHVSAAVSCALLIIGFVVVEGDPTDVERQVIIWAAAAVGFPGF